MAKYHVNPKTGNPGECEAKVSCPFGGEDEHFDSIVEARSAYEAKQGSSFTNPARAEVIQKIENLQLARNEFAGELESHQRSAVEAKALFEAADQEARRAEQALEGFHGQAYRQAKLHVRALQDEANKLEDKVWNAEDLIESAQHKVDLVDQNMEIFQKDLEKL